MKEIKIGEIFQVDGKHYVILNPATATQQVNDNNQIVVIVHYL